MSIRSILTSDGVTDVEDVTARINRCACTVRWEINEDLAAVRLGDYVDRERVRSLANILRGVGVAEVLIYVTAEEARGLEPPAVQYSDLLIPQLASQG